ncbi:MAG: heme peroxidase family protein [Blastocatellia bacterium]|nr:heme peroxidase family protein [Blastocatellia bacterium]
MQNQHENKDHFIAGEHLHSASSEMEGSGPLSSLENEVVRTLSPSSETKPVHRFGYMFRNPKLAPFRPDDKSLIELGNAMLDGPDLGEHPTLPAGYTYLAQFIAHDTTLDPNRAIPDNPMDAEKIENKRTPFLELDSLYGTGLPQENEHLYKPNLIHLKVGLTAKMRDGEANRTYINDLPRKTDNPEAIIGDPRNDENLALAPVHVAFIRFHNNVVEHLKQDHPFDHTLFEKARKKVVQHYQWIVLNDFLPKIIEEEVLKESLETEPEHFKAEAGEVPFMPVEFSAAAFRFGHSMLRDSYEWNRIKQSPRRSQGRRIAELFDLFTFTGSDRSIGVSGKALPSEWVIDWTRFFDFTGFNGIANNPKFNRARKIDTTLTPALKIFQHFLAHITTPEFRSLPVLDMIRGSRLGLPSGQDVAERLGLGPLTPSELLQEPHQSVLRKHDFHKKTPLWYYILKEAQIYHGGKRLGPVGSRIVAETFVELIRASRYSILKERDWKPDLGQKERNEFGMADLLAFANVVNPLGS